MPAERTLRLMMIVAGVWLAGVGPTRGQIPDCPAWEQRRPLHAPSPRWGHAMAFDSARQVTVLVGGHGESDGGITWTWDGHDWTEHRTVRPAAEYRSAMAYDELRQVVVLFGGIGSLGKTWEWDGFQWSLRSDSGPPPRFEHAMVYDSKRGVTVLFGGFSGSDNFNDTWEWDGLSWKLRSNQGPPPRRNVAMAYDARRQVTVLNGYGQTWEWDGIRWIFRSGIGPAARHTHAMVYDAARGVTVLFGGTDGSRFPADTWEWDGTTWTLLNEIGPPARIYSAMVYDSTRGITVLFGGFRAVGTTAPGNDTWELPSCLVDSDGDGVPDADDECDISDLRSPINIDGCDSGVANQLFDDGCTMADRIAACAEGARNHGAFVGCVSDLTNTWVRDKFITSHDKGPIQRCAAHANLPQPGEDSARTTKGTSISPLEALSRP